MTADDIATVIETPAQKTKTVAKKTPVPKTKTKVKTDAKTTTNGKAKKKVDRSMSDVPVAERRLALVKLLRKLGATSASTSRPISLLAEKLGYTRYDVYCLVYHKFPLATEGFVKVVQLEENPDRSVYLTAKGQKTDPE